VSALIKSRVATPISLDAPRNALVFTCDIAAFMVGTYFIPATTVLVGLASQLTEDKTLIGVVGMTWSVTWFLPQLVAARLVRGKRWQKPYLIIPSLIGRNGLLLMALWLLITQAQAPLLTIWVLVGCIALFNVCDAVAGVAWLDMLSRALSSRVRARVVSLGQIAGGVLGIGAGLVVERVLQPDGLPFPQNYAFTFGCAWICMALSLAIISMLRELPMAEAEHAQAQQVDFLAGLRLALHSDGIFRQVLALRMLTGIELMAASFYLVLAKEQFGLGDAITGVVNIALIIGGIVGMAAFGWLAERFTALSVVRTAAAMQFAAPVLALAFVLTAPALRAWPALVVAGFIVIFALRGAIERSLVLGPVGYLLDNAPERHRAMYVGAINTLGGVVALSPLAGGAWLNALSASGQASAAYASMLAFVAVLAGLGTWLSFRLPASRT
jgi:MFS family permease